MLPEQPGSSCSLALPEWGPPTYFGSAAHVRAAAAAAGTKSGSRPAAAAAAAAASEAKLSDAGQAVVGRKRPAAQATM
jgi:hypothetical protein